MMLWETLNALKLGTRWVFYLFSPCNQPDVTRDAEVELAHRWVVGKCLWRGKLRLTPHLAIWGWPHIWPYGLWQGPRLEEEAMADRTGAEKAFKRVWVCSKSQPIGLKCVANWSSCKTNSSLLFKCCISSLVGHRSIATHICNEERVRD